MLTCKLLYYHPCTVKNDPETLLCCRGCVNYLTCDDPCLNSPDKCGGLVVDKSKKHRKAVIVK
jgi:hypothetical protein